MSDRWQARIHGMIREGRGPIPKPGELICIDADGFAVVAAHGPTGGGGAAHMPRTFPETMALAELLRELHELEREAAAGPPTPALMEAMPEAVRRAGETRRSGWEQGFMAGWRAGHTEGSAKALALLRRIVTGG